MIRQIDANRCNTCGLCVEVCPRDVLRMEDGQVVLRYPEDCMTCFNCELACSEQAILVGPERARAVPLPW